MPARAFLLERKAAYAAAGTSAGDDAAAGAGGKKPPLTSVQHAEQLVALLRQAHAPLAAEIELVLDELTGRFAPSAEVRVGGGRSGTSARRSHPREWNAARRRWSFLLRSPRVAHALAA